MWTCKLISSAPKIEVVCLSDTLISCLQKTLVNTQREKTAASIFLPSIKLQMYVRPKNVFSSYINTNTVIDILFATMFWSLELAFTQRKVGLPIAGGVRRDETGLPDDRKGKGLVTAHSHAIHEKFTVGGMLNCAGYCVSTLWWDTATCVSHICVVCLEARQLVGSIRV